MALFYVSTALDGAQLRAQSFQRRCSPAFEILPLRLPPPPFFCHRQRSAPSPMIHSYYICCAILSHIFLKEKLSKAQYIALTSVILAIIVLDIYDI